MKFGKTALLCILFSLSCGFLPAIPEQELVRMQSHDIRNNLINLDDNADEIRCCNKRCAAYTAYLGSTLFFAKMLLWDCTAYPFYFAATTTLSGLLLSSCSKPEHEE